MSQRVKIAVRKICPTYGSGKKGITHECHAKCRSVQRDSARRVTGRVENIPLRASQVECFSVVQKPVRFGNGNRLAQKCGKVLFRIFQKPRFSRMNADGAFGKRLAKLSQAADVIAMSVRQNQL